MRVLVTRPQPQADEWVRRLDALGVEAVALPLLAIDDAVDPAPVQAAWAALPRFALAMFVSPSAVDRFFAARPAGSGWPPATLAGGTGPGTAAALEAAGVPRSCIVCPEPSAPRFDSEALWDLLRERRDWSGAAVLIVRGQGGREWLADTLRASAACVEFVEAYRRSEPRLDDRGRELLDAALARPGEHVWLFSSSEAVRQLPALAPGADWSASQAVATHARIAEAARALGFGAVEELAPAPPDIARWLKASTRSIQFPRS